jgi:hypothetical protein
MAHRTILAGATVVQLKVTIPTDELVERGFGFRSLPATFIVNDDIGAALALYADDIHLGECNPSAEIARQRGPTLDRSATTLKKRDRGTPTVTYGRARKSVNWIPNNATGCGHQRMSTKSFRCRADFTFEAARNCPNHLATD